MTKKAAGLTKGFVFLAGQKGYGGASGRPGKLIELIREGYPWEAVGQLQEAYEIRDKQFARIIGFSDRTLTRARKKKTALDAVSSDRVFRLVKILDLATTVFEDKAQAIHWLRRPQPGLGGKIPLELLDTEPGAGMVEALLGQIEFGVLS